MSEHPSGTVTFLFTDIEGSTQRWQHDHQAMSDALATHDHLIRSVVERHGGVVFKHTGDGMCAVFRSAPAAMTAAVEAQADLALPVRMGLHTGEAEMRDGDYFGATLNLTARVMDAGHGGQVLVSASTASLVRDHEVTDLGEHHLKGLQGSERIFQVGRGEFPPLRTPRHTAGNLPVELSTFVGRAHEVKSLVDELADHRLVTLIGVGGTGKTRLAVETGFAVSASFPDGCWMVELAPVSVDDAVPFAFATGLGVTAARDGDVIDDLVARLRYKRLLVIVDNCEHVLAAAAGVVERIVATCPTITVLATSREPLMVRGERLVPVPSLSPGDAERLFLERARDEAPDLVIDADQARAVAELCLRLDGLPLALELAASRVRALTPVELVANLEERFRLLVGGRRSRIERHQTMRGTLDWSYDLCSDVERAVFDRLSVFPAGFDLAAARAVAGGDGISDLDVADVVPQLLDRSLLQRSAAPDGTTRHRMLETMRAYGREHLQHQGTSDTARARHARYIANTIGALSLRTIGPDEREVSRRLNEYLPDALVALDWCIDHQEWENGLRLASVGTQLSERESGEMSARLHDAAKTCGVDGDVLDEMERRDPRSAVTDSDQRQAERGWRTIRGGAPIPTDRFVFPPHGDFEVGTLDAAHVDEFLASLDRWSSAPPINRYAAERHAFRTLALNGHVDRIEEPLSRFAAFVAELRSDLASREFAELHAVIAVARRDWADAANWYGRAKAGDGGLRTWFDLNVAWNLLTARALCAGPFELTGAELRDPWLCCREERIDVLRWRGVTATAIALHRVGLDDLADRLVAWAYQHDPTGVMARLFDGFLEIAGLPTTEIDQPGDLDTLINELFAVADELDGLSA
jgi:predicted ATPase